MPDVELEIEFHVERVPAGVQEQLIRCFHDAGRWVAQRFSCDCLRASISIVDDATIHRLNVEYLQHDWPTDVISFAFETGPQLSGEIIASWDTAQRMSQLAGWSVTDELVLYVLHGMLHLAGMDDQDRGSRERMRLAEKEYLVATSMPHAESYLQRFDQVVGE
jgi:probable rRNA maturation factor